MDERDYDDYYDESEELHPHDSDPSNVLLRAGYLRAMAMVAPPGEDRTFLKRASKSLRAYAKLLAQEGKK